MNIIVTGGNGQLAKTLKEIINNDGNDKVYFFSKKDLDITNKSDVSKIFNKIKPKIVLHFASLTRRLECAENPNLAMQINFHGTKNIVDNCNKYNSKIVFISTNEVFSGKKRTKYHEDDYPDPITTVGKTKHLAEQYIISNLKTYFIIRTSWLYSKYTDNFLQTIIKIAKNKKEIKLVADEYGSPTNTKDLTEIIIKIMDTNNYGIYHVANKGFVSRYEFGEFILSYLKITNIKILKSKLEEFHFIENPPKRSSLGNNKLGKLNIFTRSWKKALEEFLNNEYKDHIL